MNKFRSLCFESLSARGRPTPQPHARECTLLHTLTLPRRVRQRRQVIPVRPVGVIPRLQQRLRRGRVPLHRSQRQGAPAQPVPALHPADRPPQPAPHALARRGVGRLRPGGVVLLLAREGHPPAPAAVSPEQVVEEEAVCVVDVRMLVVVWKC